MKIEAFVRNPSNYDVDQLSDETGLKCEDPSRTRQEFLEESDINYIANRFMRTGELQQVPDLPSAGDFEGIFDFQTAMNTIVKAKEQFMALPAKIRSRFDNDPQRLIEFLDDPENRAEAEALKLIEKRKEPVNEPGTPEGNLGTTQSGTRTQGATPATGTEQQPQAAGPKTG